MFCLSVCLSFSRLVSQFSRWLQRDWALIHLSSWGSCWHPPMKNRHSVCQSAYLSFLALVVNILQKGRCFVCLCAYLSFSPLVFDILQERQMFWLSLCLSVIFTSCISILSSAAKRLGTSPELRRLSTSSKKDSSLICESVTKNTVVFPWPPAFFISVCRKGERGSGGGMRRIKEEKEEGGGAGGGGGRRRR